MRCPKCGGNKSSVVDSRQAEDGKRFVEEENVMNVIIASPLMNE